MPISKHNRTALRAHRKFIHSALKSYVEQACTIMGVKKESSPIRILDSIRSTRVRLPRKIVPEGFVQLVFEANETKKYKFEFCQNDPKYIHIILKNKPLIIEGQGILFYFFRELLQYLEKMPKESRKKTKLLLVA